RGRGALLVRALVPGRRWIPVLLARVHGLDAGQRADRSHVGVLDLVPSATPIRTGGECREPSALVGRRPTSGDRAVSPVLHARPIYRRRREGCAAWLLGPVS